MVIILRDLIVQALTAGYEREHMRIQMSEGLCKYINDMNSFVHAALETEEDKRVAMTQLSEGLCKYINDMNSFVHAALETEEDKRVAMTQFMGIKVEVDKRCTGEGFTLWYDSKNLNNEILPVFNKLLGIYTTALGLPIK